jgi:hypothetical protein
VSSEREDRLMAELAEASRFIARLRHILDEASGTDERKIELIRRSLAEYTDAVRHHRNQ